MEFSQVSELRSHLAQSPPRSRGLGEDVRALHDPCRRASQRKNGAPPGEDCSFSPAFAPYAKCEGPFFPAVATWFGRGVTEHDIFPPPAPLASHRLHHA